MLAFLSCPFPFRFSLGFEGKSRLMSDCAGPKDSFFTFFPPVTRVWRTHATAALLVDFQSVGKSATFGSDTKGIIFSLHIFHNIT